MSSNISLLGNITTDVLVIGGGGAGMRAAIEARRHGVDVTIVSSSRVGYGSNTAISAGCFAAAREGSSDACPSISRIPWPAASI